MELGDAFLDAPHPTRLHGTLCDLSAISPAGPKSGILKRPQNLSDGGVRQLSINYPDYVAVYRVERTLNFAADGTEWIRRAVVEREECVIRVNSQANII